MSRIARLNGLGGAVRRLARSLGRAGCVCLHSPLPFLLAAFFLFSGPAVLPVQDTLGYAFTLALFLTLSAAWELRILGDPHRPDVWPAHLLLLATLTVFFARTLTLADTPELPVYQPTALGWLGDALTQSVYALRETVPECIVRFFANWRLTLTLFLFFCAMCIRHLFFRLCTLGGILLFPWIFTLTDTFATDLLFGGIALLAGVKNLLSRPSLPALQTAALKLRPLAVHDPDFVCSALRILDLVRDGAAHPVPEVAAIHPEPEQVLDRMIRLGLLELQMTVRGKDITLAKALRRASPLALLSRLPRALFLLTIVCIWVALPIDLIPDALPFVGSLDDITLSILALHSLREKDA